MTIKSVTAECSNCESGFNITFEQEIASKELPAYCPFCGDPINEEELIEEYIDDEESLDDEKWQD